MATAYRHDAFRQLRARLWGSSEGAAVAFGGDQPSAFLHNSSLALALISSLLFTPFALNNFLQGRPLLGLGAATIIAVFLFNAWTITRRAKYYATPTWLVLVPAIILFLRLCLDRQGIIGVFWCYPAVTSFFFLFPERKAWLANAALLAAVLPVAWSVLEPALAIRMVATLFMATLFAGVFVRVIVRQQAALQRQAATDPLTGLFNRTFLKATLEQAAARAGRDGMPVTLLMLDIDHFKAINDSFGHDAGDKVLKAVADVIAGRVRRAEGAFRLGGEEFLVVLHNVDAEDARALADDLRGEIAKVQLLPRAVTVSLGVAELLPGEAWDAWMRRGDRALYRAKNAGRDRVDVSATLA